MQGVFAALDRFFIDIIGTIIPGSIFALGIWIIFSQPNLFSSTQVLPSTDVSKWTFLVIVSYVIGHAISSLGKGLTTFIIEPISQILFPKSSPLGEHFNFIKAGEDLRGQIQRRADFTGFVEEIQEKYPYLKQYPDGEKNFGLWRNLALSISKDNSLVYRFVFISLLNLGIATDLILLASLWLLLNFLQWLNLVSSVHSINWVIWTFLILASIPFLERYYQFHRRSLQLPFSTAFIALKDKEQESSKKVDLKDKISLPPQKVLVYLAGGFYSNWQDQVKLSIPEFSYIDPRQHRLTHPSQYTLWDLEAIAQCHICFAYLESENPGGYALALELGYAKALNKIIVFIDGLNSIDNERKHHIDMLKASSTQVFESLDEGIEFLKTFAQVYK